MQMSPHEQRGIPLAVHSEQELDQMFDAFRLGTEGAREHFRHLAAVFEGSPEKPAENYELHFSNRSSGLGAGDANAKEEERAQLARDPE